MRHFSRFFPVDRRSWRVSLHTRVSLVLTALAASLLLVLAALWLRGTEAAIHDEVEAAGRVSAQMLGLLARDIDEPAALVAAVQPLGRIRAHALQVIDRDGQLRYQSPPSTYKAGRQAPDWLARWIAPQLAPHRLPVGGAELRLLPDPSRALVDAWDELRLVAGWAAALLLLLFLAARQALAVALRPLDSVMAALDKTGFGRFDLRLPLFATPELGRLSRAFNGMADRLQAAVDDNVRLETEREVASRWQARLAAERQEIARELHDELAQGVTAVRVLAAAIVQRSADAPAIQQPAQSIVAVTGDMQSGVRHILQRLRPPAEGADLVAWLDHWAARHGEIALDRQLTVDWSAWSADYRQTVLRLVQEGLTNVLRHAAARHVTLRIDEVADGLRIRLADDGRGLAAGGSANGPGLAGCGLGLTGMRERLQRLGGRLEIKSAGAGGVLVHAWLPRLTEEIA